MTVTDEAHLLLHVVQRIGRVYSETDEDDVGVRVAERPETIIILLASRIPQRQFDVLAIDLHIGNVVLEDSRHVDLLRR